MTTIRAARTYDAAAIAALCGELGYASTRQQVVSRLAAIEAGNARVWVAENAAGEVVAWLHIACQDSLLGDDGAEIHGLIVTRAARGMGLGRALIEHAVRWASERGCTRLCVRSRVERERAHRFYQREGFVVTKSQRVFVLDLARVEETTCLEPIGQGAH